MLHFLAPYFFWSLLALLVPILIHLFSHIPSKTISFGTLKHLKKSEINNVSVSQITDWPLLLLRLLLIVVVVILLAQPVWVTEPAPGKWILANPNIEYSQVDEKTKFKIDSLLSGGYEARLFAKTFPEINFKEWQKGEYSNGLDYWQLLSKFPGAWNSQSQIYVVTEPQISQLKLIRKEIKANVSIIPAEIHRDYYKIEKAGLFGTDSIHAIMAYSASTQTERQKVRFTAGSRIRLRNNTWLNSKVERDSITIKWLSNQLSVLDSVTISSQQYLFSVVIYHSENRLQHAQYFKTAFSTNAAYRGLNLSVSIHSSANEIPKNLKADWLINLSNETPLDNIESLVKIEEKKSDIYSTVNSQIYTKENNMDHPEFFRTIPYDDLGTPIWYDQFGNTIMSVDKRKNTTSYNLYSKFDNEWTNLFLSSFFPQWIDQLISQRQERPQSVKDVRLVDYRQIEFDTSNNFKRSNGEHFTSSLQFPIWLLSIVLFLYERFFSMRRKNDN